jgi:hypothetical protein
MKFYGVNEIVNIQRQQTETGIQTICIQLEVQGEKGKPKDMVLIFQQEEINLLTNIIYNN